MGFSYGGLSIKENDKESNNAPNLIDIETLSTPLSPNYQSNLDDEGDSEISRIMKNKKDKEKEKNYNYKERIIYNSLPTDYITKSKSDTTNIFYYQNFFKTIPNFDNSNYFNLLDMRTNYLFYLYDKDKKEEKKEGEKNESKEENKAEEKESEEKEKKEKENEEKEKKEQENVEKEEDILKKVEKNKKKENKKEEEKNHSKEKSFDEKEFTDKDTLFSLLSDLADMMNYDQNQGDEVLYYSIIERIFSNIFFETETFFDHNNLNAHSLYETKLCECIDLLEVNFLSKKEKLNKAIHFLKHLQKLSLSLCSWGGFMKILKLMKTQSIAFNNYNSIYENYFKIDFDIYQKSHNLKKMFDIKLENELIIYECCFDDKYLYLSYDDFKSKKFFIEKFNLITESKECQKEIKKYISIAMLNDNINNKLDLLIYKPENEFELVILNKKDFLIERKITIFSPIETTDFLQFVTSASQFYLISKSQIYVLDISNLNKTPIFKTLLVLKNELKVDKSYYFISDDFINFSSSNSINLQKKSISDFPCDKINNNERSYYNNSSNIFYKVRYLKGQKSLEVNKSLIKNFKLRIINSNKEINKINDNIESNLSLLYEILPCYSTNIKEEKEKGKKDPFKYYLEYTNNLESLLNLDENNSNNNEDTRYNINKGLAENYYLYLYNSMIKYFYFFNLEQSFDKNNLIININNDITFDIVKKITSEEKDYILLYIYTYFLTQSVKTKKDEKFDKKINWVVKFCLSQEKLTPYLFEILREIYKFEPSYINSTNIADEIIFSKELTLEEQIWYFSLISLDEKKDIFFKILDRFLSIEKIIILSGDGNKSYSKLIYNEVCYNFIHFFQDIKKYNFEEKDCCLNFKKILEIFINNYNSLIEEIIKEENKKKINYIILKNSSICQILFLLINTLFYNLLIFIENNQYTDFIKLLFKTLLISQKYSEDEKAIEHDIKKEEIIIVSECDENIEKVDYVLPIVEGNIFMEYDLQTNYPYKLLINNLEFDEIGQKELPKGKSISIQNKTDKIINNDSKIKKFGIKFSNYKNDESFWNIIVDIRKTILFFILSSSLNNNKNSKDNEKNNDNKTKEAVEKEITKEKMNKIIKSDFFNDISILSKSDNIIEKEIKYFDFQINEFFDNKIAEEYNNNYVKKINSLFEKEEENKNEIIEIYGIKKIQELLSSRESFKKLMDLIQKEFLTKNPWGTINEKLLKNIILSLFSIIIYEFDLFSDFDELSKLNEKGKLLLDNDKLKLFISLYTKINQIKKLVSKKKQDISLIKDIKEKEVEELLNKFISNINDKINFVIKNKKMKKNKKYEKTNIEDIEKTIALIIDYLIDDNITELSIQKHKEELNENIINKEKNLNYLNKLLYVSTKKQDILDIICCMFYIKNGEKNFNDLNMEILGVDNSLIDNYKKQIYIYILQIINKLKTDDNKYDIYYYFYLINLLFYSFNKDDYKFIEISQLYEILNYENKNKFNELLLYHNSNNFNKINDNINIFRISYDSLYKEAFYLFKLMTFLSINQFNNDDIDIDKKKVPPIKYIFDFIVNIFNNYINQMNDFINQKIKSEEIINEEKLNSFLILFYRCILKEGIFDIIKINYNNILTILFQILIYSSSKNKILSLKIIEILFLNEKNSDEDFIKYNIESFTKELKEKNNLLYNFIYSKNIKHTDNIFIDFLFNFSLLLQQNIDHIIKLINGTENNMAISLVIIKMIQNKLLKKDNSKISKEIIKFIENNYSNPKFLNIILQVLGVDLDYTHIGSYLMLDKEKNKKGIIVGFSNSIIDNETIYQNNINYNKGDYIYYIKEDNLYRNFLTNLDFSFECTHSSNATIITNNLPVLPLENNKLIYEYLIENITKYEEKNIYFILRYIKILLLEEDIKLNDKIISYIMTKSLNKDALQFKCKLITLERLEKLMIPYICETNPKVLFEKDNKENENINTATSEEPFVISPNSPDIYIGETSLFFRTGDEHSLGFSYQYKKVFNYNLFTKAKKILKPINSVENAKKYKEDCILMTKDLLKLDSISPNINYIIIPDSFNEAEFDKNKIKTVPIIMIDSLEYKNISENAIDQQSFMELENLFMVSLQRDVSSLIFIEDERIPELVDNQRDFLLGMLNEEPNYEAKKEEDDDKENVENDIEDPNYTEFKNYLCGKSINNIEKNLIFNKLISLICRRLIITVKITQKIKIPIEDLRKLVKLMLYENLSENSKDVEVIHILKNFVLITTIDEDIESIKCFTDISFLDCQELVDDQKAKEIETEEELLKYENLNNDMFLVDWFFLCQYTNNSTNILEPEFVINYLSKLISKNINETLTFILRVFKHLENNIDKYIQIIEKNKNVFCSKELMDLYNSCEEVLQSELKDGEKSFEEFKENFYEKIQLFFSFFNICYTLKINHNIDLDLNHYEDSLLLNIYKIISLLLYFNEDKKSEVNYYNFLELFYKKGLYKYLIDYDNQFSKPLQTFKFNYYDKTFNSNFVMNFQNLIPKNMEKNIKSLSLILKGVDNNLINNDNSIFVYESEKCKNLQDYIKISDKPKDKRILLLKDNFTISYPNKNFFTHLYGGGYNDKNSLGIQIGNKEKFSVPQHCVGLETCKNIIDFKFGYYHTFVQTGDGDLFTCGTDKGSSFRYSTEFPYFNKLTYFYSLSKENGGIKMIAANNFNSSILLTKNNKMFCCGKNNASCLGNTIKGEGESDIPLEMPEFLPVIKELNPPYIVKEIACGFKSTLFLLESGYAFTCGSHDFRQCGSKEKQVPYYREYFPLYPPRGTKFTHVVAGEEFFVFLVEEINDKGYGKLYSMGQNEFGRSGAGELNFNYTLQRLEEVEEKSFTVISSRNENAAAVSTEGELYTFGNNNSFPLGLPKSKIVYVPTKVESLKDYIVDNVGISQFHMIVIARRKEDGKRVVLSCGDNEYKALCTETSNDNNKIKEPKEIKFFLEKRPDEEPIRASLSRYQTYLMSIKVDLRDKINKILSEFKCSKCQKESQYYLYFDIDENKAINYYCNKCSIENNKKIFYVLNTIDDDTKNNIELLLNDKEKINELFLNLSFEENKNKNICLYCSKEINTNVYQSYSNEKLILCENCYLSKCPLIEYPQLFMTYNSKIIPKNSIKKINIDSILYPNIVKADQPYLELDVVPNYTKEYIISEIAKNKEIKDLYNNTWKLINRNILNEMRKFKEFYEGDKFNFLIEKKDENEIKSKETNEINTDNKEKDKKNEESKDIKDVDIKEKKKSDEEVKNDEEKVERKIENKNYEYLANIAGKSNKYLIYEIILKLIEQRDKTDIKNEDFKNLDLYKSNNKLFYLAFELSNRINNQIFKILDLSIKFKFPTVFKKVIESSLKYITTQERREIFQRNISSRRASIQLENNEITISRIKANLFYQKDEIDKDGKYTVFSQLFRKTKNYSKNNYLSKKNHRLFTVKLKGEGASDFSGVYNEVISIISFELQSKYLDLFIKTPNNKNNIGQNRDKYIPNPLAKSQLQEEMYYFIGNLMLHAITSGNVLNLNLHPIFYKKLLNNEVSFNEIETVDKLSYKLIITLQSIKDEKEFNEKYKDLYFAVHSSSDNSLIDLVKDGQYKKVTFESLPEYIKLYKEFLLKEIDDQVSFIRKGIFDILGENLSTLLTPNDLEEYICGAPTLDLQLLRERTLYDQYEADSPTILNFWKALESFTEEEKSKYLRFVSGRNKLPDPRNIMIIHKISLLRGRDPDKKMPTSSTCYFTLNLPDYSSYEILRDKLRYVINNCSAIDSDFFPEDGAEAFQEE